MKIITIALLFRTESCQLLKNFSIRKQNRIDGIVLLLWLVSTKPLRHGFKGSVPSLNQSLTNGMIWHTGETLYAEQSGYFLHAFGHKLSPLIGQHFLPPVL